MRKTILAMVALIAMCTCTLAQDEVEGAVPESVVMRFLAPINSGVPDLENTQILVGKLPDNMPIKLPMPEDAKILGSLIKGDEGIEVILDVNQNPEDVLDFYKTSLAADNWSEVDRSGGFVWEGDKITFCQGVTSPALSIGIYEIEDGPTDVRITVNTDRDTSPCIRDVYDWHKPLPKLAAPPGARQYGTGGSYMGSSTTESTTLATDLNSTALEAYFADQLKEANWTRIGGGQNGPLAWSTWELTDENGIKWNGRLLTLEIFESDKLRWVVLQASLAEAY